LRGRTEFWHRRRDSDIGISRLGQCGSELRAAIDGDDVAGDPAGLVRDEERDDRSHIVRLADPLQRLHSHHHRAALFGLGEVRHVGIDHAGRDGVYTNAARAERYGEILD
jgi:hypothetical protein